jgi:SAM-dependent methyltransferase
VAASSDLPYPSFDLANRVIELPGDDLAGFIEYEMAGRQTKELLLGLLPDGYSLDGRSMLDFGCGAGRTLRHFHDEAATARFVGCDIDQESIDWLGSNLCPPLEAIRSGTEPPLPFEDGSFDFIWAISVFTHLTANSAAWLLELHRLLKPGGMLMASYMGELNSEDLTGEEWDEDRIGMNVLRHDESWDLGGPMVMMSDWWVDEHWGRAFRILGREFSGGQTWAMMERRDVDLTPEGLMSPGDDPREIAALRHNVTQLQTEIEGLRDALGASDPALAANARTPSWWRRLKRRVTSGR